MGKVVVNVAEHSYTMNCPDGEEAHLRELAQLLDTEVRNLRRSVGSVGDIRLLVMSGLMVADRLSESLRRAEALEEQVASLREQRGNALRLAADLETNMAIRLDNAAARLQALARGLGTNGRGTAA